jgi:uncharacterized membrane protein
VSDLRREYLRGTLVVAVFALSIPIAFASLAAAKVSWLLIIWARIFARRRLKSSVSMEFLRRSDGPSGEDQLVLSPAPTRRDPVSSETPA